MMSELIDFSARLISNAKLGNIRYLIAVEGEQAWGSEVARLFADQYCVPIWAGDSAPESMRSVVLKKAKKHLGQECDCLIYNAHQGFDAEALGALSGTVVGGGVLLMLVPSSWFSDTDSQPPFVRRLTRLLSLPEVVRLRQHRPMPRLPVSAVPGAAFEDTDYGCRTAEQYEAVTAIRRVVTGHRKRPLVLTADRGRGKSSALGIAAASLMKERSIRIGVTAPAFANAATLFLHTARCLNLEAGRQNQLSYAESQLLFIAPDQLLAEKVPLDFLIVDEAAAIPAPMLAGLLRQYNRIAFASTVHGYEGTGRGFAIKFRQRLDELVPHWRSLKISQPIRWAEDDPLEKWIFRSLLLDAEYVELDPESVGHLPITYRVLATESLVNDEPRLSQLFGLLVNAHYQTSPADIVQLLDDDTVQLLVAESGGQIVGCCLLSLEGGFSESLARQVLLGQRRPKGHLLAQSVAAHIGIEMGARQRCVRIMRIAVHPDRQLHGIGSGLLAFCRQWALERKFDYLGTSFALVSELYDFWFKAGYSPVRLGVTKDAASGAHSLLSVLPLSVAATDWFRQATALFAANFQAQRVEQFSDLDSELFLKLYQFSLAEHQPMVLMASSLSENHLQVYAQGGLGYDLVVASLEVGVTRLLTSYRDLPDDELKFAIAKVLQRQPWSKIVADYGFVSRKMAEKTLREFIARRII